MNSISECSESEQDPGCPGYVPEQAWNPDLMNETHIQLQLVRFK